MATTCGCATSSTNQTQPSGAPAFGAQTAIPGGIMAGCTFDNQNYVGAYGPGFVVVVGGQYQPCPSGFSCTSYNGVPIFLVQSQAEQYWNQLEGCGTGGGGGGCVPACPVGTVCQNGTC